MNFQQRQRREIIEELKSLFITAAREKKGLERSAVIALLIDRKGCTARKAKEYIDDLLYMGYIEEDDYGLWLKDKSNQNTIVDSEASESELDT